MTKKEWYKNRILWKAKSIIMLEHGYELFEDVSLERQRVIRDMFGDTQDVVIVLWENQNKFTLVSTDEFFCNYDGIITKIKLDDIETVKFDWDDTKTQRENKTQTEYIFVNGHKVWSGKAEKLFGLMRLLRMFPVNVPQLARIIRKMNKYYSRAKNYARYTQNYQNDLVLNKQRSARHFCHLRDISVKS